ncbi:MAG: PIN domain-containing protein [Candidatus Woesearchaeota archaeon]
MNYLIDTSIWIDLYENRKGYKNEPLGDYAFELFKKIILEKNKIVITDFIQKELQVNYGLEEIRGMLFPFKEFLEIVYVNDKQKDEAKIIAEQRNIPKGDALHAIVARDNNLILITRDKHFKELKDIVKSYKPEEII